jgi:hypothetical protein
LNIAFGFFHKRKMDIDAKDLCMKEFDLLTNLIALRRVRREARGNDHPRISAISALNSSAFGIEPSGDAEVSQVLVEFGGLGDDFWSDPILERIRNLWPETRPIEIGVRKRLRIDLLDFLEFNDRQSTQILKRRPRNWIPVFDCHSIVSLGHIQGGLRRSEMMDVRERHRQ